MSKTTTKPAAVAVALASGMGGLLLMRRGQLMR